MNFESKTEFENAHAKQKCEYLLENSVQIKKVNL